MNKIKYTIAVFDISINQYITGGARRRIEIANRLSRRGWSVTMYTFDKKPISPRWYPLKLEVPLKKRVDGIKADFIICGDLFESSLETKKGTFLTAKANKKKIWLMQLYRPQLEHQGLALYNADIVKVANSTHMANLVKDVLKQKPLLAIGGVDTKFFYPQPEPDYFSVLTYKLKNRLKQVNEIQNSNKIKMQFHATNNRKEYWSQDLHFKDKEIRYVHPETAKRLLKYFSDNFQEISQPNPIKEIANFRGIDNSQTQVELRQKYWNNTIFLSLEFHPSYGWCNPIAEAMACGRACIAIDSPHVRDLIIDGKTGLLAKPDERDIQRQINRLKNPELRKKLINKGLEHIKQFDWENVLDAIEKFLVKEITK